MLLLLSLYLVLDLIFILQELSLQIYVCVLFFHKTDIVEFNTTD